MKKFACVLAAIVMCVCIMSGCGGSKNVDLSEVVSKLNTDFSLSLNALDSVDDLNTYYNIDVNDVKQFAAENDPTNDAPKEIVLVEGVDSDAAGRIEEALTARYNSIYSTYSSYSPEQLDMVKSCKVTKDGNFVSLIVSDNAPEMLDVYYEYVK